MTLRILAIALLALPFQSFAQEEAPLFETRAVWFATVLRDGNWPRTGTDAATQQRELRERIQQAASLGLNTFIFQVVARGDALYPSERLPWSRVAQGPGEDPGYDPLAVAIEEAHRQGMELHAWYNVFRIGDVNTEERFTGVSDPQHVIFAHPGWVQEVDGDWWIDPSVAEARAWLVGNVLEIVENYDVDAMHFDFIRYPQGGLPGDGSNFQFDDRGFDDIGDWRRNNVTQFVRDVHTAITEAKPWVKIGSTPLGNYQDNGLWPALWAYSGVFQESRRWLQEGLHDYLAPQIYFSTGTEPEGTNDYPSPDFAWLINDWETESAGRPIFAGIAAYKPAEGRFPVEDLPRQIDRAREVEAEGQVFFRYDHFLEFASLITERYPHLALPASMAHRFEAAAPSVPANLTITSEGTTVELAWSASEGTDADPLRGYAVFRRVGEPPDLSRAEDLFRIVDGSVTSLAEAFAAPPDAPVYYQVAAISRLGLRSAGSPTVSTDMTALPVTEAETPSAFELHAIYPNPVAHQATITYQIAHGAEARLVVYDVLGREVATLRDRWHAPGQYEATLDASQLASGTYLCELRVGARRVTRTFVVAR